MSEWQFVVIAALSVYAGLCFGVGFIKSFIKRQAFEECKFYSLLGAFVWADAIVFGLFWLIVSLFILLKSDWELFILVFSVFWAVRSMGEVQYWIHEQFTQQHRNSPTKFSMERYFPGEAIWVAYQIFWQCICVISIISTLLSIVRLVK